MAVLTFASIACPSRFRSVLGLMHRYLPSLEYRDARLTPCVFSKEARLGSVKKHTTCFESSQPRTGPCLMVGSHFKKHHGGPPWSGRRTAPHPHHGPPRGFIPAHRSPPASIRFVRRISSFLPPGPPTRRLLVGQLAHGGAKLAVHLPGPATPLRLGEGPRELGVVEREGGVRRGRVGLRGPGEVASIPGRARARGFGRGRGGLTARRLDGGRVRGSLVLVGAWSGADDSGARTDARPAVSSWFPPPRAWSWRSIPAAPSRRAAGRPSAATSAFRPGSAGRPPAAGWRRACARRWLRARD
jgi:hypothetical protein